MRFYIEVLAIEVNGFNGGDTMESDIEICFLINDKTLRVIGNNDIVEMLNKKFKRDGTETDKYFKLMVDFMDKYIKEVDEIVFETFFTYDDKLRCKKEDLIKSLKKVENMYKEGE